MADYWVTVLQPVCPDCGMRLTVIEPVDLDWRDERERVLGENAFAVQRHRAAAHPVVPAEGDVVFYFYPWRGMILGHGPLVVRGIVEHDLNDFARSMGRTDLPEHLAVKYHLVNPQRASDYYLPSTGDIRNPITFEVLEAYVPPPVEASLFDLLGDEWAEVPDHAVGS